jgi:N-acetylglucosaminyldiphosphoundecaprenol N-acetyl-beta-D-mannosaminyltransferase
MIENRPLGHLKVSSGNPDEIFGYLESRMHDTKQFYFMPLNLSKYVASKKDPKLQQAILSADLVISDGVPIVWLSRRLGYHDVSRVTGIDLAEAMISISKKRGWRMFFFGASASNVERAIKNLDKRFDGPDIGGFRHGYFMENDIEEIIENINHSNSDVLLLGLGMPQKEHFIHDYLDKIDVRFCLPVGGAFDIWAETKRRTPQTLQRMGIEWLYRSIYDRTRALSIARYGLVFSRDFLFLYGKRQKASFLEERSIAQD